LEYSTNLINWNEIQIFTNTGSSLHITIPRVNTRDGHEWRLYRLHGYKDRRGRSFM
jgi:hypothetical protein